jgi:hypothetical protein
MQQNWIEDATLFCLKSNSFYAMVADAAAASAAMVCESSNRAGVDWLVFLAGISLGCVITLVASRLGAVNPPRRRNREDDDFETLRSSLSTAEATSISLDNSDSDKESITGFDIDVTNKVLGALKDHLQKIDTERTIESLGKIHISCDDQMDLTSVLRRWSMTESSVPAGKVSPQTLNKIDGISPKRNSCCCSGEVGRKKRSRRSGRTSVTFEDGINPSDCCDENCSAKKFQESHNGFDIQPVGEAKVEVVSEESWFADDADIIQVREFDERVLSKISTLEESRMYLRRTRAVSMLSSRLMAAPDEKSCYEIVSRLLVPLFHVDRISYVLMKDADNMLVKQITVNKKEHMVMGLDKGFLGGGRWEDEGYIKPLKGTAVEYCSKTLKPHYCPNIKESPFITQRQISTMGLNTILATPILVNGNKFIGCISKCLNQ